VTLAETGIPSAEQVKSCYPPAEVRGRGPVAVFECFQRIPCDPCYWACPRGAVLEFQDINDLPRVDWARCNGCGLCVARCPGLAVFVVDETYAPGEGLLKLPHEFYPLPAEGEVVDALDRGGSRVGEARVVRVVGKRRGDTPVVWIAVDKSLLRDVRAIAIRPRAVRPRDGGESRV